MIKSFSKILWVIYSLTQLSGLNAAAHIRSVSTSSKAVWTEHLACIEQAREKFYRKLATGPHLAVTRKYLTELATEENELREIIIPLRARTQHEWDQLFTTFAKHDKTNHGFTLSDQEVSNNIQMKMKTLLEQVGFQSNLVQIKYIEFGQQVSVEATCDHKFIVYLDGFRLNLLEESEITTVLEKALRIIFHFDRTYIWTLEKSNQEFVKKYKAFSRKSDDVVAYLINPSFALALIKRLNTQYRFKIVAHFLSKFCCTRCAGYSKLEQLILAIQIYSDIYPDIPRLTIDYTVEVEPVIHAFLFSALCFQNALTKS